MRLLKNTLPLLLAVIALTLFSLPQQSNAQESCINFSYYQGGFKKLKKKIRKNKAKFRGQTAALNVGQFSRRKNFAYKFTSELKIDVPGVYEFFLTSNAQKAILSINGQRVLKTNRRKRGKEVSGEITLSPGYHDIQLLYFHKKKQPALDLQYYGGDTDYEKIAVKKFNCEQSAIVNKIINLNNLKNDPNFITAQALGDGTLDGTEECDDGNFTNGDGCDSAGNLEAGYVCNLEERCGNGVPDYPEICDDNNLTTRDGCDDNCYEEVLLTNFSDESSPLNFNGGLVDTVWNKSADNYSVSLPNIVNPKPSFFFSNQGMFADGPVLSVSTRYTSDQDDDYLGFVFGYNPGELNNDASADYLVLAWKDSDQNFNFSGNVIDDSCPGGVAPAGLRLFRVKGMVGGDELWQISDCATSAGVITSIADSTIYPTTGYEAAGLPDVKVVYTPSRIQVYLNDVLDINLTGTFPANGQYGFYTFAQQGVTFEPLKSTPLAVGECIAVCGDGLIVGAEICDDGNMIDGDGCSSFCQPEGGYTCSGLPSTCTAVCGDGLVAVSEECDDGNNTAGDGCNDTSPAQCLVESGFACTGSPSTCAQTCGNGTDQVGEECDDGNLINGDGCSSTCNREVATSTSVKFTVAAQSVTEAATSVDVTVAIDQYQNADFTIPVNLLPASTAEVGFDYVANSFDFTIPFGQLTKTVTITLKNDPFTEPDETLIFEIDNSFVGTIDSPSVHTVTILDDDPIIYTSSCVEYDFYQGDFSNLAQMLASPVVRSGIDDAFDITSEGASDLFGYVFRSKINLTTAGTYTFYTSSDDGSRLYINNTLVVDNDGLHGNRERQGTITLSADYHDIRVEFFERNGGQILQARYQGPGISKRLIPNTILNCLEEFDLFFPQTQINVLESAGVALVPIAITDPLTYDLTVPISILSSSTASAGNDYTTSTPLSVTIPAGQVTANIPVDIIDDSLIEPGNEFIDFRISMSGVNQELNLDTRLNIIDNDDAGNTGVYVQNCVVYDFYTGNFNATVDNIPPSSPINGCTSDFNIALNGASDDFGYRFKTSILINQSGTYTFFTNSDDGSKLFIDNNLVVDNDGNHPETEVSGTVTLTAGYHDLEVTYFEASGDEILQVLYSGPGITKRQIPSDKLYCDAPLISFTNSSQSANEGIGSATVGITLSKPALCNFTATYSVDSNSEATAGSDYNLTPGNSVNITRGQTSTSFSVGIIDDSLVEPTETIVFDINASQFAVTGTPAIHTLRILDSENATPTVDVTVTPANIIEHSGTDVVITATASNPTSVPVTITLAYTGTADSGDDYLPDSTQIVIPANATTASINLDIVDDCPDEDDETIIVSVTNIQNGIAGSVQGGTVSIEDGDYSPYVNKTAITGTIAIGTDYLDSGKFDPASEPQMTVAQFYQNVLGEDASTANANAAALRTAAISRFDNYFGVDLSSGMSGDWILVPFVIPPGPAGYNVDRISGLHVGERGGDVYEVGYTMVALADGAMLSGPWATSVGYPSGLPAPRTASAYFGEYHIIDLHVVCDNGTDQTPAPNLKISFRSEQPSLGNEFDQVVYDNEITGITCDNCTPDISGTGSERSARQVLLFPDGDIQRFVSNIITFVP